MAAIAIGIAMGVPLPQIRRTVTEFRAVEHRIEFVAEKNGVVYYNDSKGTNTGNQLLGPHITLHGVMAIQVIRRNI